MGLGSDCRAAPSQINCLALCRLVDLILRHCQAGAYAGRHGHGVHEEMQSNEQWVSDCIAPALQRTAFQ